MKHGAYESLPVDAPLLPEVLLGLEQDPQTHLELATKGVLRYLWQSRWGPMLIEVKNGRSYVNDQAVEPFGEHKLSG